MDKNSFIGLLLIGLILIGYTYLNRPSEEELAEYQRKQDSIEAVQQDAEINKQLEQIVPPTPIVTEDSLEKFIPDSVKEQMAIQQYGSFHSFAQGEEKFIEVENDKLKLLINTKGGKIVKAQLKEFKKHDGSPLILLDSDTSTFGFQFFADNRAINTDQLFFTSDKTQLNLSGENSDVIKFRLQLESEKYIEFVYGLKGDEYVIDFDFNVVGLQNVITATTNHFELTWKNVLKQQEKGLDYEKNVSTVYYSFMDQDVDYLSETKSDEEDISSRLKWVSFKQQFFSTALIANEGFDKPSSLSVIQNDDEDNNDYLKIAEANLRIPYRHAPVENFGMQFYLGPNHYQTLKALDLKLERQIPLGWGIFGYVNRWIIIPLFNFFDNYIVNYGIIILILTLLIKIALMPFTYKSYLSQAKMKVLKPEVEEIQQKFKGGDQMKQQQETMALYRKAGVNPLGGCIPMLFQLPILYAMFRFFPASIELRQKPFLWADDLSTYDSIYDFPGGFEIPFYGDHISLFTLLMGVSTVLYTMVNQQMTATTNPQMKWMMYLMPIMLLFFFNSYSSGLSYYYFLANMVTFGQTYLFKGFFIDEEAIHKKVQERKKKAKPVKKSKFQAKLEKMAKERGYKPPKRK